MTFLRNLVALLFSDSVSKIISFLVIAYFARVLHPDGLGEFLWVQSLILMLSVIPNYGLNEFGILKISPDRSRNNIESVVGEIVSTRLVLTVITFGVMLILFFIIHLEHTKRELLLWSSIFLVSVVFSFEWFYTAIENQVIPAVVRILTRSMYLIGSLLFVHDSSDVQRGIILFCGTEGILQLVLFVFYKVYLGYNVNFKLENWKKVIKSAFPLALYTISSMMFVQADVVIIGFFLPPDVVGQFAGALRVVFLIMSIKYVLAQLLYPKVVYKKTLSSKALGQFLESLHTFSMMGALFVFVFLFAFSDKIVELILGNSYRDSQRLFAIMSIGLFAEFCWIAFPYSVIAVNQKIYSAIMIGIGIIKIPAIFLAAWLGNVLVCSIIYAIFNVLIFLICFSYINLRIVRLDIFRLAVIPYTIVGMAIIFLFWFRSNGFLLFGYILGFSLIILSVSERKRWNRKTLSEDYIAVTKQQIDIQRGTV